MAQQYDKLDVRLHKIIAAQHIFFTATAAEGTRITAQYGVVSRD